MVIIMKITSKNLSQRLEELEQEKSGMDYDGNHYIVVESSDELICEDRTFDTVTLYVLAIRVNDALNQDNCLPLYRLEWHYDGSEFQQLMEKYGSDWGALDWTKPDAVSLEAGYEYDPENDNIC